MGTVEQLVQSRHPNFVLRTYAEKVQAVTLTGNVVTRINDYAEKFLQIKHVSDKQGRAILSRLFKTKSWTEADLNSMLSSVDSAIAKHFREYFVGGINRVKALLTELMNASNGLFENLISILQ